METVTEGQTQRERQRQTERERDRQTDRHKQRQRHTQRSAEGGVTDETCAFSDTCIGTLLITLLFCMR